MRDSFGFHLFLSLINTKLRVFFFDKATHGILLSEKKNLNNNNNNISD